MLLQYGVFMNRLLFFWTIFIFFSIDYVLAETKKIDPKTLEKKLSLQTIEISDLLASDSKNKSVLKYQGYKLHDVLDLIFQKDIQWKSHKNIVFECTDGYKAVIPVSLVVKYQAYLVTNFANNQTFEIKNHTQGGKIVQLKPFYLVWNDSEMQAISKARFWPYQIDKITMN
jgi:hypothetical protein